MKKRVAIVGGGISGLTAAYILHRNYSETCEVTLFEAENRLGGIIETVHSAGFTVECGPDSWVTEKPWAEQLARELGLADELLGSNDHARRTYIAHEGSLAPLPEAMHMMVPTDLSAIFASPLFTEAAKHAYMGEPARAEELREAALANRGSDADESVAAFVRRHFGDEVADTVARPLLAGILGADIDRLSARALLGPFIAMEARHGSLILGLQQRSGAHRSSVFTTLSSGLGTLVNRLQQRLPTASVQLSTTVIALHSLPAGWAVDTTRGRASFDRLLIATPLDATRRLLALLPFTQAQQAATLLPSNSSSGLVVALGYRRRDKAAAANPKGFGFLVPAALVSDHSLLACTFLDQKFPNRAPEGATLLRAFFPSSAADQLSCRSDSEIATIARDQLIGFLGPLPQHADVAIVRRWPRSLPKYEVGHLARIAQFNVCLSHLPRLLVAGNALNGVGLPDLIRDATQAAHALAGD